ncbi:MAG: acyl-CoA dehydrogenase [Alphaproteobacteria bacterium]|nr:acyl-CoA dehydrogenase [Alphaproteobacteria bacterium]
MAYHAPVEDILFALKSVAGVQDLFERGVYENLDEDTLRAIVEEAGKFGSDVLDPLNRAGDESGARLIDGHVVTTEGWREAYQRFCEGGWNALTGPEAYGGQDLPEIVSCATSEIWNAANLSFGLCPLLTMGAIDALKAHGSKALVETFLPKMISGEWSGTMNLTEPHAGSDVGAIRTRAEPQENGTYKLFGTKTFITYGDHDLTENIVHMVLARLPDAPSGTRGISLFLVPKVLVNEDGSLGERNDVVTANVEHKLGIHGSPTCTLQYGENGGAVGYLVGEENRGLNVMFIMMNAARLGVGLQGVAIADRATQRAIEYANERTQGRGPKAKLGEMSPIIAHADIRRTILTMKSMTQATRMICFATARELDVAEYASDKEERALAKMRGALLTPVAKAFSTDVGVEVASMGVQVHGGMGFMEETGAAQYYRDARILPIYEGTNGIQAIDLVTRKLPLGDGAVITGYLDDLGETVEAIKASNQPQFGKMGERLGEALEALRSASSWMIDHIQNNPEAALAGATPYLRLFGLTAGGVYLAKGALDAQRQNGGADNRHTAMARFFAETQVPAAGGLALAIMEGADSLLAVPTEKLSA